MTFFQIIIQLIIRLLASFCIYGGKISLGVWIEIEGLNQQISYWNLAKVISRVFQAIKYSFWGGFMAYFLLIIQLLIHLSTSLWSYVAVSKQYMVFGPKLKDWIKRYLIETWHRSFQEYSKSYRIAFWVALWLHFEQLSSYLLFIGFFFNWRRKNNTWILIRNWRIEPPDILLKIEKNDLKSIPSHIE